MAKAHNVRRFIACLAASAAFAGWSAPVLAQQAQQPEQGDAAEAASFGDIVVTAQKRSQRINNVGMTITAVSGDQLQSMGIKSADDLVRIEPSFKFASSTYGTPVYTLRGIGFNDSSLAASPTVSIYTDEIPYAFSMLSKGASFDNERVEILKGPQGTLFGQNATAGAVNYIAAKPTRELSAGLEATVGRFGYVDVNGFISGPITDTLRVRIAGDVTTGGGWQQPYTRDDGDPLGDQKFYKWRALFEWDPTPGVELRFGVNGWKDKSEYTVPQLQGIVLNRPSAASRVPDVVNYPLAPQNIRSADWTAEARPRANESFIQPFLRAQIGLSDSIDLISLTSYAHFKEDDLRSNDGMVIYDNKAQVVGSTKSFFQELRLAGRLADGALNWMLGGQYSRDKTHEDFIRNFIDGTPAYSASQPILGVTQISHDRGTTKAVFGNVEYAITPQIKFNGGLRYTKFDLDHAGCSQDRTGYLAAVIGSIVGQPLGANECLTILPDRTVGSLYENGVDEDNLSWRAQLDWQITPTSLVYASLSRGYKAGNVPNIAATTYVSQSPVKQESVLSYEAGFKLGLFNRMMQLNGAAFYYDYSDKQMAGRSVDPLGIFGTLTRLVNVPKSRVYGAELSVAARPASGLMLNAALSYLNSKVTGSFMNWNTYGGLMDFKGLAFPNTPKWSGNLGGEYRWEGSSDVTPFIGADMVFQSKTVAAFGGEDPLAQGISGYIKGDPGFNVPGYAVFNARLGVELKDNWTVQVYGKNIFNKRYLTDVVYQNDAVGARVAAPATYGLTVRWRH
ncbi:TonB-dependent receptor [Sphingobium yanoikuyae]|uniref:TonB-dependent receptor n=1 Tax=Sphingobium yanoikuyae TaxID=13690 RepID=A0A9X7U5M3_SPHYA|nr:TonB-dependent receptor [Sphingobium yanoikuyae]QNG43460.1 TonB-dependent receptor [Sphingobium yanoikuyae]